MWCFQGLEAMGRTGTGAGMGEWLLVRAGVGPIDCHAAPKQVVGCVFVSSRCHTGEDFLARLGKVVDDGRKKNRGLSALSSFATSRRRSLGTQLMR